MFLDTTVIIELMLGETPRVESILKHIENELLFISVIQLGEVNDWCIVNDSDSILRISQLKEIVHIIPLNEIICVDASVIKHKMRGQNISKFSLIDGVILASANYVGQQLLTLDTDFRKAENVLVIQ